MEMKSEGRAEGKRRRRRRRVTADMIKEDEVILE